MLDQPSLNADRLAARDEVVMRYLPLVKAIAARIRESLPICVELDDVIHAGVLGLMDAASKYDSEKQVAFSSYAKHRIRGAILDSLREQDSVSRDLRRQSRQVDATARELAVLFQRAPTEEEVAARLGIVISDLHQLRFRVQSATQMSQVRRSEQEELPALEVPSRPDSDPDFLFSQEQMRSKVGAALQSLPTRYQKVVHLYYSQQKTMKEIGVELGVNESRVSQIHRGALEKLNTVLRESGISSSAALCH